MHITYMYFQLFSSFFIAFIGGKHKFPYLKTKENKLPNSKKKKPSSQKSSIDIALKSYSV